MEDGLFLGNYKEHQSRRPLSKEVKNKQFSRNKEEMKNKKIIIKLTL